MRFLLLSACILFSLSGKTQFPPTRTSAQILHELQKANTFGSVLYIAAHPDDENTRLISYFENHLKLRTAYLSLTRGDGGQNLIGTETGAAIGVLRTQELLAARRIDGGEQMFSRAVDFGYSKSSLETLEKWGKEAVLHDVVWAIRAFQPDVLVTRFPPNNYAGHGHHEASAMLAEEAFDLAGDPKAFPEQLEYVDTWKPTRLYFNASSWWIDNLAEKARSNDNFLQINVGAFNPLLGESYAQIAARSRSEHKSQGFGSDFPYGLNIEYLEYVKGTKARPQAGVTDAITTGWERIGLPLAGAIMTKAIAQFDHLSPHKTIPALVQVLKLLEKEKPTVQVRHKKYEIEQIVLALCAFRCEALAPYTYYTPGESVRFRLNIINSVEANASINEVRFRNQRMKGEFSLKANDLFSEEFSVEIPATESFSNPYWLNESYEGLYAFSGYHLMGKPNQPAPLAIDIDFRIEGYTFTVSAPFQNKVVDPVKAVIYSPVEIVPPVTFNFSESAAVMTGTMSQTFALLVQNHADSARGSIELDLPRGWTSSPRVLEYASAKRGEVQRVEFLIEPSIKPGNGDIRVLFSPASGHSFLPMSLQEIQYDHIPACMILSPAQIPIRVVELSRGNVQTIGYIEGPGDEVAKYLRVAGYYVEVLSADAIRSEDLSRFDAIVTGIRAFNTRNELNFLNTKLNEYVERGGTWIVQYNTSRGVKADAIGPYKFEISRERVTDEESEVNLLRASHPAMTLPNKITTSDFDGWVQERGLYFAGSWAPDFEALISWSDPGEPPRTGGLIAAPYGKGYFVYTGISFFRQLPAGVPGAYRLMANLLHLSKNGAKASE